MLSEWCETVEPYEIAVVDAAVAALRKRNVAFAPSTGQIHAELERAAADASLARRAAMPALPAPKDEYSPEHRAAMSARWAEARKEILAAANADYGHVPKGTKPAKPIVVRTVPKSFREEWERQRARPARTGF